MTVDNHDHLIYSPAYTKSHDPSISCRPMDSFKEGHKQLNAGYIQMSKCIKYDSLVLNRERGNGSL